MIHDWLFYAVAIPAVILPGAAVGIALGYGLAAYVRPAVVELAVGLIAVAFSSYRLWATGAGRSS